MHILIFNHFWNFIKKSTIFFLSTEMRIQYFFEQKKSGEFWSIFHGLLRCRHFICTEMFVEGLQLLRTRDNQAAPGPGDAYKCASACPWG